MESNLMQLFTQPATWAIIFAIITPPLIAWLQAPIRLWIAKKKGQAFWKRFPISKKDLITVPASTGRDEMKVLDEDEDNLLLQVVGGCKDGHCHVQYIPWTEIEGIAPTWRKVVVDDDKKLEHIA